MMNKFGELARILAKIIKYTTVDPKLKPSLRRGLPIEDIELKLGNFPLCVPEEVKRLYQWCDGMDYTCSQLFCYYRFLSLDKSLAVHKIAMEFDVYEFLPLFEFDGRHYCIQCSQTKEESGSIWFVYHETFQVYDSLRTMLLAYLECYETGAYQPTLKYSRSGHSYIETKIDERQVAEIKLKHNPIRQEKFEEARDCKSFYHCP